MKRFIVILMLVPLTAWNIPLLPFPGDIPEEPDIAKRHEMVRLAATETIPNVQPVQSESPQQGQEPSVSATAAPQGEIVPPSSTATQTTAAELKIETEIVTSPFSSSKTIERMVLKDADVKSVLRSLVRQAGKNIIFDPRVSGQVTMNLENVSVSDAFHGILKATGHGFEYVDDLFIIKPIAESFNFEIFRVNHIDVKTLDKLLREFLSKSGKISLDPATNAIVVYDNYAVLENMRTVLKKLDVPPRQVFVEAAIVSVQLADTKTTGSQWAADKFGAQDSFVRLLGTASNPFSATATGLFWSKGWGKIGSLIEILHSQTQTNVLAHPRIIAVHDKEAQIKVADQTGYTVTLTTQTGATQEDIRFLESGTILTFTPHVTETNEIIMDIHPEVSTGSVAANVPSKSTTEAKTQIKMRDGETIVLGGLIKEDLTDTEKGIPLLKDIPLLGLLFKSKVKALTRREILVFITPILVDPEEATRMQGEILRAKKNYNDTTNEFHEGFKSKTDSFRGTRYESW